ncbi:disease resistance protein RPP13-like [Carex rostrata]
MTEAVLNFVLGKLANIIDKEIELLGGVAKNVKLVQRELSRIQCCLRDADSKRKGDARVQNWLNELRDVAYRIEDATDTFFLEFEDNRHKDLNFLEKFKQWRHKPMRVPVLHKLGTELEKIQKELEEISKSRVDYGIEPLQDKGKGEAIVLPFRRATYQEFNETEVIGLHADKKNILKLLHPEKTLRRAVITIVGTGGLGKTTLAHMIYKSARAKFEYHIMLSISQRFSLIDLLRKILLSIAEQFNLPELLRKMLHQSKVENQDVGHLISEIKRELSNRRYLIILDDVWEIDLWYQLKDALPDVMNGSRVLMTSRFINVAKSADCKMPPYELNLLDDKKSLDLLLKKAFPFQEPGEKCPSDLLELAEELSKKCRGLPLALIVIGGILSTKENSYLVWKRVLRTMNWHSDGKDCMQVLAMSYEDMPYYLKACFLYLASFPEDYEISAKRLIRMWVAEGFLPQEERKTMEETAEDCLEQLFQRSMIQVSSRCMNGSIKCCQVHDLLRNLAMHEAGLENFVTVFSQELDFNQPKKRIRRASLQFSFQSQQSNSPLKFILLPQVEEYVGPNIRSLLLFGIHLPKCSNFKLLRVVEVVGVTSYTRDLVKELDKLMHLKYLGSRNCNMHIDISSHFFSRMKTLETLDVRGTIAKISNAIWTIGTLRHVLCDCGSLDGPISTINLRNLQTLQWVSSMREWDKKLPHLYNLCKLGCWEFF